MVKKLLLFLLLSGFRFTYAETIRTDVLVIGSGAGAVSAALQSSHSKLKTILLVKSGWLEDMQSQKMLVINAGRNLPSGIWGEFRKQVRVFYKSTPGYDTTYNAALRFEPFAGAGILKKMADTTKNLTIKLNTPFIAVVKDGTGWQVSIKLNGKIDYIRAKVLIDATETGEVVTKAGATLPPGYNGADHKGELYRTSITAVGDMAMILGIDYIPMRDVIVRDADNLFIADKVIPGKTDIQYLPLQMGIGQGVGAMAAYCAFFKTTSKNLKVRLIQGELLDFNAYLLPLDDINPTDRYFRAIEQIAATGLIKGEQIKNANGSQLFFQPDLVVTTAEIKPVLAEIYSRAFIWFNKAKPADKFTVGNLLSFISEITLTEPKGFYNSMAKEWKSKYKFTTDFDINRPITRREFAILANQYLNPFARVIDLDGRMIN